ncbi:MAG: hypothetical protein JRJ51_11275 [Deltaproteobacteria bacterium]|nr:hypothetical protein [Deltaproteobacteria bacterium]
MSGSVQHFAGMIIAIRVCQAPVLNPQ